MLTRALGDLLSLLRRRIIACLAIRYGVDNMSKVAFQLAQHDVRMHALAMEWIDVTLTGVDRAAVAILDPALVPTQRLRLLEREFALPSLDAPEILRDLIDDPDRPVATAVDRRLRGRHRGPRRGRGSDPAGGRVSDVRWRAGRRRVGDRGRDHRRLPPPPAVWPPLSATVVATGHRSGPSTSTWERTVTNS